MVRQDASTPAVDCPHCGAASHSIKCFTVPHSAFFALIYFSWTPVDYIACPSCMRKLILVRMLFNIIPANVTWPIFAVIWGIQLGRTYSRGHSREILKQLRAGAPA